MQTERIDGGEVERGEFGGSFKCSAVEFVKDARVDCAGSGERCRSRPLELRSACRAANQFRGRMGLRAEEFEE
jgi:hypothetical protein